MAWFVIITIITCTSELGGQLLGDTSYLGDQYVDKLSDLCKFVVVLFVCFHYGVVVLCIVFHLFR